MRSALFLTQNQNPVNIQAFSHFLAVKIMFFAPDNLSLMRLFYY